MQIGLEEEVRVSQQYSCPLMADTYPETGIIACSIAKMKNSFYIFNKEGGALMGVVPE